MSLKDGGNNSLLVWKLLKTLGSPKGSKLTGIENVEFRYPYLLLTYFVY